MSHFKLSESYQNRKVRTNIYSNGGSINGNLKLNGILNVRGDIECSTLKYNNLEPSINTSPPQISSFDSNEIIDYLQTNFNDNENWFLKNNYVYDNSACAHPQSLGFWGGVLAPNGNVIFVPSRSPNIGIYNPFTNTYTDGPAHGLTSNFPLFKGGVLEPNGNVILIPCYSPNIGIYDPIQNTYTAGPAHNKGINAFEGGVLARNGKVIFAPFNSTNLGIYDPIENTYVDGPSTSGLGPFGGVGKFNGAVLAPNGKVILVPDGQGNICIYDPSENTLTAGPSHGQGNSSFSGGVLAPNGKIILIPTGSAASGDRIGIYDPSENTYTAGVQLPTEVDYDFNTFGGVLSGNGKVILIPSGGILVRSYISIYDPINDTIEIGPQNVDPNSQGSPKFNNGAVLTSNGKIVFIPANGDPIGIYGPQRELNLDINGVLSPYLNTI